MVDKQLNWPRIIGSWLMPSGLKIEDCDNFEENIVHIQIL